MRDEATDDTTNHPTDDTTNHPTDDATNHPTDDTTNHPTDDATSHPTDDATDGATDRGVDGATAVDAPPRWSVRVVRGRSMLPTLRDGDRLLVRAASGRHGDPRPGSLVVVRLPGDRPEAVKRLLRREPGGWWVERDNPAEGVDSWLVGAIPENDLVGVVRARLWPRPRSFGAGRPPRGGRG